MSGQRLTFPDEEFSMTIHDAGMFTVKEINRLKILQDVIERNLRPGQAAGTVHPPVPHWSMSTMRRAV
jgi:hypothetical protein